MHDYACRQLEIETRGPSEGWRKRPWTPLCHLRNWKEAGGFFTKEKRGETSDPLISHTTTKMGSTASPPPVDFTRWIGGFSRRPTACDIIRCFQQTHAVCWSKNIPTCCSVRSVVRFDIVSVGFVRASNECSKLGPFLAACRVCQSLTRIIVMDGVPFMYIV